MEISPLMMAWLLRCSFFFGAAVGVFYDLNRIIRVLLGVRYSKKAFDRLFSLRLPILKRSLGLGQKRKMGAGMNIIVFLGDVLTFLFGAVGLIVLNYSYNSGDVRFFSVFGVVLGFVIYYNTFGRLIILVLEPIAFLVKYVILSFFIIIGWPFFGFGKNIAKYTKKILFLYTFTLEKRKEKLYNVREEVYLRKMAKNGFLKEDDRVKKER